MFHYGLEKCKSSSKTFSICNYMHAVLEHSQQPSSHCQFAAWRNVTLKLQYCQAAPSGLHARFSGAWLRWAALTLPHCGLKGEQRLARNSAHSLNPTAAAAPPPLLWFVHPYTW